MFLISCTTAIQSRVSNNRDYGSSGYEWGLACSSIGQVMTRDLPPEDWNSEDEVMTEQDKTEPDADLGQEWRVQVCSRRTGAGALFACSYLIWVD